MLKLERASKTGEINVRLRTRERLFNPVFCFALTLAIALHVLGIILFHVTPFMIESQWIFPSVKVNTELGLGTLPEGDASVLAHMEENKLLTPSFHPPSKPIPQLPSFRENTLSKRLQPSKKNEESFKANDQRILPITHFPPKLPLTYDSFEMAISGRLAEYELLGQIHPKKVTSKAFIQKVRARYDVRINEKTGRIFWVHRLDAFKQQDLNQEAEKILSSLHFKHDPQNIETEGVIEITFAVP